ncbi:MAG: hypothetical protein KKH94_08290 [Candidatus Omnitrophica bacterium]|nr:hypothetical protein [Candidatus Omnitrophota bacterium]
MQKIIIIIGAVCIALALVLRVSGIPLAIAGYVVFPGGILALANSVLLLAIALSVCPCCKKKE